MSTSSSPKSYHVCTLSYKEEHAEEEMGWLVSFLERTFFGACSVHQNLQNNDLNRYCINCDVPACKFCIASDCHQDHKLLKIYRHVYKDVVALADMETLIDCSKIQPYRCNKKMIVSLNPLPHCGTGEADKEGSCRFCRRKLYEPMLYRFCSIACKFQVKASSQETDDPNCPIGEVQAPANDEIEAKKEKRRKRKGIPCRAPFF